MRWQGACGSEIYPGEKHMLALSGEVYVNLSIFLREVENGAANIACSLD